MKKTLTRSKQGGGSIHGVWNSQDGVNSSHGHTADFCPVCHAYGNSAHEAGCKGKKVQIPATAQLPRKNASARVWRMFVEKFVDRKFVKDEANHKFPKSKEKKPHPKTVIKYKVTKVKV